ncbi:MAG: hypothetical protein K0Q74_1541 [Gammaproteobacteria bacterium]|nr:hypothetical protein [Gammaproteobacteria bacterium]
MTAIKGDEHKGTGLELLVAPPPLPEEKTRDLPQQKAPKKRSKITFLALPALIVAYLWNSSQIAAKQREIIDIAKEKIVGDLHIIGDNPGERVSVYNNFLEKYKESLVSEDLVEIHMNLAMEFVNYAKYMATLNRDKEVEDAYRSAIESYKVILEEVNFYNLGIKLKLEEEKYIERLYSKSVQMLEGIEAFKEEQASKGMLLEDSFLRLEADQLPQRNGWFNNHDDSANQQNDWIHNNDEPAKPRSLTSGQ